MKQNINIGNVVDDGTGDYLRAGGLKINQNFDELYNQLGDGSTPHSAGAWKNWTIDNGQKLEIKFGQSYVVNTSAGAVNVVLPKGSPADYNKVVRIRDVYSSWAKTPVTVSPASGDTLKGTAAPVMFTKNLQDLELVYCPPGRWEYLENKFVDRITNSNLSTVAKKSFIATEGQQDFNDVFEGNEYNTSNTIVYRRGNRLYYSYTDGKFDLENSDFGSPLNDTIGALDGKNIRLKVPCVEGETIIIETFMDGIGTWQSSYNRLNLRMLDSSRTLKSSEAGVRWVGDLSTKTSLSIDELGLPIGSDINPYALEVLLNGRQLVQSGEADLPTFYCDGAFGDNDAECQANGGIWTESDEDFAIETTNDIITSLSFAQPFEHGDIVSVRWYNNNIGSIMSSDEIIAITDDRYINSQETINLVNRIEYTDYQHPSQSTKRAVADEIGVTISNISMMFDILYPVGTIYENGHNSANPSDYMGFGVWQRYAEGKTTVGWNSDSTDPNFAYNNDYKDAQGNPSHSAGGSVGSTKQTLTTSNIPALKSNDKVLIADDNGTVVVGGCQFDPDASGPDYDKYKEQQLTVNPDVTVPVAVDIIQPSITTYKWIRVA